MKIEIKHKWSLSVLFGGDYGTTKEAAEAAVNCGADLRGADLCGANLRDADLGDGTTMPHGESWKRYKEEVVPALMQAGGKPIDDVLATGCWDCHSWSNCPMHAVFGIAGPEYGPILLVPRIKEFVHYFDAGLIPKPSTTTDAK